MNCVERIATIDRDQLDCGVRRWRRAARPPGSPGRSAAVRRLMPGTSPTVDTVRWRAPMPRSSWRRWTADHMRSKLARGSPIPMNTMFDTRRSPASRRARTTCSTISPAVRWRSKPGLTGRAEPAGHGTPGLARHAHRGSIGVVHEDGLDAVAVAKVPQPLDRLAVVGGGSGDLGERRRKDGDESMTQGLRHVGQLGRARDPGGTAHPRPGRRGRRGSPASSLANPSRSRSYRGLGGQRIPRRSGYGA